jgi:LytS/YehU family sensor histidine kinase
MVTALNWAMFTPLIVMIAQRLPLRPPHLIRNLILIIALIPPLAITRAAMGGAVLNLGEGHPISADMIKLSIDVRTHRYIAILAAIFFVSNLVDAQREVAKRERQRVRAQTLLARTEIEQLRTRLQPEFALRMLRHIGSVVRDQPRAADALIVTLSGILRRSIGRGEDEQIPLADELEHLDRCLDLCRVGDRFSVAARYVADDDVLERRVPAHVLQPLIETVVLDLTSGDGGSVYVCCKNENVDVSWIVAPGGATKWISVRIPSQEATA